MKLSIIIVNFNGRHFLDTCLRSVSEHVPFKHEVIVVDNASSDGSLEYLRVSHPGVKVIESSKNLGFAGGNNLGASIAKGDFLLLLNSDTELLDDLSSAISIMEGDSSIGILGAMMLGKDSEFRHSAGHFPEPWRLVFLSSLYKRDNGFETGNFSKRNAVWPVDWVEGSFLLTPASLWRDIGGLDDSYFMYVEDIDYARRVVNSGKQVVFFPDISYVHFGGYARSRLNMLFNGFRRYHKNHSSRAKRMLVNLVLDAGLIARALFYLVRAIAYGHEKETGFLCLRALRRER